MTERVTDAKLHVLADYRYLADGTKIGVTNEYGDGYEYLGSLIYRRTASGLELESTDFAGGRIDRTTMGYRVNYFVRDYLGSVRAIADERGQRIESMDYLPFGSRWSDPTRLVTDNRYLYNGKEWQPTGDLNVLDYGARHYDPTLGRWFNPDPVMQFLNPYTFCANDPVNLIDPDGKRLPIIIGNDEYRWDKVGGHWGYYDKDDKPYLGNDRQVRTLTKFMKKLMRYSGYFRDIIKDLVDDPKDVEIIPIMAGKSEFDPINLKIIWLSVTDPNIPVQTEAGTEPYNPFYGLAHELVHAWGKVTGKANYGLWLNLRDGNNIIQVVWDEILVIHQENLLRASRGDNLRTHYLANNPFTALVDQNRRSLYFDKKGDLHYGVIYKEEERFSY